MSISRVEKMICEVLRSETLSEASDLRKVSVDIFVRGDKDGTAAQILLTVAALALRSLKGKIRVHFPEGDPASLNWQNVPLADLLHDHARTFGEPERLEINPSETGSWKIGVGLALDDGVTADASGWMAGVNSVFEERNPVAAPAAVFAGCCAFAKIFSAAVLRQPKYIKESWRLDVANLSVSGNPIKRVPPDLNFGFVRLLGAGAIGSGVAFTLWLSGWKGKLEIIDDDFYDEPNHETTLVVGLPEVRRNRKKAIALSELASRPGLEVQARVERIVKDSKVLREGSDAFLCAVDNPETRRILDTTNTGLLLNAGVGGTAEAAGHVVLTRHGKSDRPLSSRYLTQGPQCSDHFPVEFRDDCSRVPYLKTSLAAPFIGASAGALLTSACALHALGCYSAVNYFKLDLLKLQAALQTEAF